MNKNGTPQNLKPQPAKWNGPTVAVRIPERLKDMVLAYARMLDSGNEPEAQTTVKLSDLKTYKLRGKEVVRIEDLLSMGLLKSE